MRTILHSDLNNFYASVECAEKPELKNKVVVVCGEPRDRHGIVLAKNMPAKALGIKTGMVLWQARTLCPNLISITANFDKYLDYSRRVRAIYERYTDRIEPFGIDEAWLDVTHSKIFGTGENIANTLRETIFKETGLTASVGVSYNKIFAKLGSDMKKPNATTIISSDNFKEKIWGLPVQDLLYVGNATTKKMNKLSIETIGDLANFNVDLLKNKLGKWGQTLWDFANGHDKSEVKKVGQNSIIKSVGNSLTARRDLTKIEEVEALLMILSESVASRMRKYKIGKARTLSIWVRDNTLSSKTRNMKFPYPSNNSHEIWYNAKKLFLAKCDFKNPIRALGVSVCDFIENCEQLSMFDDNMLSQKRYCQDKTVDKIRLKYGHNSIMRARVLQYEQFNTLDIEQNHIIHPVSFFK